MLLWPMDLIIAGESARFSDPTASLGLNGHEYFVHTWELGARKAKELLFTGQALTAAEAHQLGRSTTSSRTTNFRNSPWIWPHGSPRCPSTRCDWSRRV
jgi:1,4-dihydroxy-2-naphthoyl-CoA synthase